MPKIVSIGEILVEIMRKEVGVPLGVPGDFVGPFPSGAPAIFADAVARLGGDVGFIGAVGDDPFGHLCYNRLKDDGVDISKLKIVKDKTTACAFISYNQDGSRDFIFHLKDTAADSLSPEDLEETYFQDVRIIHICGSALSVSENMRDACIQAARIVKSKGGKVFFDPNIRPQLLGIEEIRRIVTPIMEICDVFLPSGEEAGMITGIADPVRACKSLSNRMIVVLKEGERGCTAFVRGEKFYSPAISVEIVDPTGAGDCFAGAMAVGMLEDMPLPKLLRFANIVAGLSLTRKGPMEGAPHREVVEELLGYI
ncbi:MAG: sugar kinase [Candidatus Bathyarchaeia archaeon]